MIGGTVRTTFIGAVKNIFTKTYTDYFRDTLTNSVTVSLVFASAVRNTYTLNVCFGIAGAVRTILIAPVGTSSHSFTQLHTAKVGYFFSPSLPDME